MGKCNYRGGNTMKHVCECGEEGTIRIFNKLKKIVYICGDCFYKGFKPKKG